MLPVALTCNPHQRTFVAGFGSLPMKYLYWMIVIFGIMQIPVSLVVSQFDDPETQYDESEAPVNLAYPVSFSAVSSTLDTHVFRCPVTISRTQQMVGKHGSVKGERVTHPPRLRL